VFFEAPPSKTDKKADLDDVPSDWLVGYAPGQPADMFKDRQAKLVPAGSDIVLELHYMPEGKATTDQSSVGLVFAKEPPKERVMTLQALNETFKIPPGDPNYRVDSSFTVNHEVTLLACIRTCTRAARTCHTGWYFPTRDPKYFERTELQLALAALVQPGKNRLRCRREPGLNAQHTSTILRTTRRIRIRRRL
jgi:hypothetical protein